LQQRVHPTDIAAAQSSVQVTAGASRPDGGADLARSWEAAYGRSPNPSEAYRLAIRAVEHVALPVILPGNDRATLGTAKSRIAQSPGGSPLVVELDVCARVAAVTFASLD
ncbi:MAG: hypothetical protein ACRC35_07380, partial [Angustibacter sp.]